MEGGSELGTYIAYGFIGLFLLVAALAVLRSTTLLVALLILPLARAFKRRAPSAERQPTDAAE